MTTPKEKAIEIFNRFRNVERLKDFEGMDMKLAIECAIIAVDEILKAVKKDSDFTTTYFKAKEYWNEVKKEIKNL